MSKFDEKYTQNGWRIKRKTQEYLLDEKRNLIEPIIVYENKELKQKIEFYTNEKVIFSAECENKKNIIGIEFNDLKLIVQKCEELKILHEKLEG